MDSVVITKARYLTSAVNKNQYPKQTLKEFVFIGRSNVGKSSLINSLSRVHNLARVSGQPGKTQTINFYELTAKLDEETRQNFYLVDLPGYGYAKTGKESRKTWSKFIEEYLTTSANICFVCQLIDIRHELMKSDKEMFERLIEAKLPVLLVATKTDKLSRNEAQKNIATIKKALGIKEIDILAYSSVKNIGRDELLQAIARELKNEEAIE